MREWFCTEGYRHDFAGVVLGEWDMLFVGEIEEIYKAVPLDGLGMTGLTDLDDAGLPWAWTDTKFDRKTRRSPRFEFWLLRLRLPGRIRRLGANLGASYLSRGFLERYAESTPPGLGNDEVRVLAYAQTFGCRLINNGLLRNLWAREDLKYFNANSHPLSPATIERGLRNGRQVFHPYREPFPFARWVTGCPSSR